MSAFFAALVVYLMIARPDKGDWPIFVTAVLASFFAAYALRNLLVENFRISRWILNGAVILGAAAGFLLRKRAPELIESLEATLICGAFIGLYLGCYFWLLSDPRVERENP